MRIIHSIVFVCVLSFSVQNSSCSFIGDAIQQGIHTAVGVIKNIPKLILTPSEVFEIIKNVIIGVPAELTLKVLHEYCEAAVNADSIFVRKKYTPQIENLSFIFHTTQENVFIPITNPTQLWINREYNPNLPLVIFVTGWKTNLMEERSEPQDELAKAYLCRGNVNFVTLDTAAYIDTIYTWSAFNTELIGQYVSQALEMFVLHQPPSSVHLIGHSLGAQICGAAGRLFGEATGQLVHRITGLDPANPCFSSGSALSGLSRGDAEWVDVIHTNPGVLGKKDAIGDADFYPNGMLPLQPGSYDPSSSHARAWEYYVESVYPGNEDDFLAKICSSEEAFEKGLCHGPSYPMGYAARFNLKGILFLKTNSKSPYGKNAKKDHQLICSGNKSSLPATK